MRAQRQRKLILALAFVAVGGVFGLGKLRLQAASVNLKRCHTLRPMPGSTHPKHLQKILQEQGIWPERGWHWTAKGRNPLTGKFQVPSLKQLVQSKLVQIFFTDVAALEKQSSVLQQIPQTLVQRMVSLTQALSKQEIKRGKSGQKGSKINIIESPTPARISETEFQEFAKALDENKSSALFQPLQREKVIGAAQKLYTEKPEIIFNWMKNNPYKNHTVALLNRNIIALGKYYTNLIFVLEGIRLAELQLQPQQKMMLVEALRSIWAIALGNARVYSLSISIAASHQFVDELDWRNLHMPLKHFVGALDEFARMWVQCAKTSDAAFNRLLQEMGNKSDTGMLERLSKEIGRQMPGNIAVAEKLIELEIAPPLRAKLLTNVLSTRARKLNYAQLYADYQRLQTQN